MALRKVPPDKDLVEKRVILDEAGIARELDRIAAEIVATLGAGEGDMVLVGIRTGGAFLAERLARLLSGKLPRGGKPRLGAVDITLYRDDVFRGLPKPEVGTTELPDTLDGMKVVLVDDVLFTGRTVRAAMDVLADYGRPQMVQLAVLVDRGRRELPIQPDYVGAKVATTASESVRVMLRELGEPDRVVLRERP